MLTAQNLKQKNSEKIVVLEKSFLYIFCFRTPPPKKKDAFLIYSAKSTTNLKMQVILGRGNPATLGRKNRTSHVTAPSVLTWHRQLFITVFCVRRGEGRGPLTWQPLSQNFNVSFNLSKK
jgi:hypothetical protein